MTPAGSGRMNPTPTVRVQEFQNIVVAELARPNLKD